MKGVECFMKLSQHLSILDFMKPDEFGIVNVLLVLWTL